MLRQLERALKILLIFPEKIIIERRYPAFGNPAPRDVASRAAKERCDAGYGVNDTVKSSRLCFCYCSLRKDRGINPKLKQPISEKLLNLARGSKAKYGNLFDMYQQITDDNPYETPMKIYPVFLYNGRTLG